MTTLLPQPAKPYQCGWCRKEATGGAYADWQLCSQVCVGEDRAYRFRAEQPEGEYDPEDLAWRDYMEEQRQREREERLETALVLRHAAGGNPDLIPLASWFELVEADLGHHAHRLHQRIEELVRLYELRQRRAPGMNLLTIEGARQRMWAMVPARLLTAQGIGR